MPTGRSAATGESSLTLQRGLALLQAVADAETDSVGISELATAVGVSRAAVYRLLVPLVERGLLWRDGTRVRLGAGLLVLAGRVLPQLRVAVLPILRELAESVGATAFLSLAEGAESQVVAVVEPSWTVLHVGYRVGSRQPIDRGATGRALQLAEDGPPWVAARGELEVGTAELAAPVRGVPGVRACVGMLSFAELHAESVGPQLVRAATSVAATLR
ncbi:IclR-like helix-turn-helix domain-containing protein [Tamaricihabitans halophyticus]|uniref:IclR-like helix-turn-helix domain-containing protein n=1 Tax=Tamaricihabitans halophyticus TaxID=1262583 RepID=A0A4R2RBP2_9PSEU|nr:helix-turn-helix domain-containing protein [Tamaricihabitans halophyticus]TCP57141.1 IclR-like helix-turn-helix domain-containing protein [Tamaricihabitans halophyticus]